MTRVRIQSRSYVAVGMVALLSGCATIMGGGSSQAVRVEATPAGATFTVKSSSGLQMASGTAPQAVRLPRKNEYQIDFTVPGYQPQSAVLTRGSNGWIWGNLLIGWIVGFAIDFATGSAYKLEPALVQINLVRSVGPDGQEEAYGVVRLLDDQGRQVSEQRVLLQPVP